MERMNEGKLAEKLEALYLHVKDLEDELLCINADNDYYKRIEAIK